MHNYNNSLGDWFRETFLSSYRKTQDQIGLQQEQVIINEINKSNSGALASKGLSILLICAGASAVVITIAYLAK